jgi:hypothetical protein
VGVAKFAKGHETSNDRNFQQAPGSQNNNYAPPPTSLAHEWHISTISSNANGDWGLRFVELLLKIGSMVVPLRPAFCLMVILFVLSCGYLTTAEFTGYELKTSVDLVCLL